MNYSELHENKRRGTFDFPIELYYVDESSPRYQMPLHWHLEYELILVLKGSLTLFLDGESFELCEGDCAWVGDGVVHGGVPSDCVYECVVFDLGTLLEDTPICARSTSEFLADENGCTSVFKKGSLQAVLADKVFEAMEKEQKGYEWTTVGLMWQLMGSMIGVKSAVPCSPKNRRQILRLKNVLTYIRNNYENPITLSELAEVAGMTPRYFCRAFAILTGRTPIEYLNYYRIELAGERLILTSNSVTDIAFGCGFNDMSYFSRMFFRLKGATPTAYRKEHLLSSSGGH